MRLINPTTLVDFASNSAHCTTMYFLIGTQVETEALRNALRDQLHTSELLVQLDESSECLCEMEQPKTIPALGAWSSIGALVGYAYDTSGVHALLTDARRFLL
jgi:hypothetical protein